MSERLIRDQRVLAKWLHRDRPCLLLADRDRGPVGVFAPKPGDEHAPLEDCPPAAMASGLVAARAALQTARRVIETGKEERLAFRSTLERSGAAEHLELSALDHQAQAHGNALAAFERCYGSRYPITEDLTKPPTTAR